MSCLVEGWEGWRVEEVSEQKKVLVKGSGGRQWGISKKAITVKDEGARTLVRVGVRVFHSPLLHFRICSQMHSSQDNILGRTP